MERIHDLPLARNPRGAYRFSYQTNHRIIFPCEVRAKHGRICVCVLAIRSESRVMEGSIYAVSLIQFSFVILTF